VCKSAASVRWVQTTCQSTSEESLKRLLPSELPGVCTTQQLPSWGEQARSNVCKVVKEQSKDQRSHLRHHCTEKNGNNCRISNCERIHTQMQLGVRRLASRGIKRNWDWPSQRTSTLHYTNATHNRRVLLRSRTPSLMDVRTRAA